MALGRTVDELLDSITYRELVGWGSYYETEPWGEWRADARSAQIAAILANSNRDVNKHPQAFEIKDFMLFAKADEAAAAARNAADGGSGAKMDPALMAWLFRKSGARVKE